MERNEILEKMHKAVMTRIEYLEKADELVRQVSRTKTDARGDSLGKNLSEVEDALDETDLEFRYLCDRLKELEGK